MDRRRWIAVVAAVAGALGVPASAQAANLVDVRPCDDAALSKAFQRWADPAHYKLAPGGDFEGSLSGWTLTGGAKTVAGGEPWDVGGVDGDRALALPQGASATAPATCVNLGAPTLRLFARSTGGLLPVLKVDLLYRKGLTGILAVPAGVALPSPAWSPTLPMLTASAIGATLAGGEAPLSIRITALSGSWQVDDLFVDPYARG
jgi:hypothetical protein